MLRKKFLIVILFFLLFIQTIFFIDLNNFNKNHNFNNKNTTKLNSENSKNEDLAKIPFIFKDGEVVQGVTGYNGVELDKFFASNINLNMQNKYGIPNYSDDIINLDIGSNNNGSSGATLKKEKSFSYIYSTLESHKYYNGVSNNTIFTTIEYINTDTNERGFSNDVLFDSSASANNYGETHQYLLRNLERNSNYKIVLWSWGYGSGTPTSIYYVDEISTNDYFSYMPHISNLTSSQLPQDEGSKEIKINFSFDYTNFDWDGFGEDNKSYFNDSNFEIGFEYLDSYNVLQRQSVTYDESKINGELFSKINGTFEDTFTIPSNNNLRPGREVPISTYLNISLPPVDDKYTENVVVDIEEVSSSFMIEVPGKKEPSFVLGVDPIVDENSLEPTINIAISDEDSTLTYLSDFFEIEIALYYSTQGSTGPFQKIDMVNHDSGNEISSNKNIKQKIKYKINGDGQVIGGEYNFEFDSNITQFIYENINNEGSAFKFEFTVFYSFISTEVVFRETNTVECELLGAALNPKVVNFQYDIDEDQYLNNEKGFYLNYSYKILKTDSLEGLDDKVFETKIFALHEEDLSDGFVSDEVASKNEYDFLINDDGSIKETSYINSQIFISYSKFVKGDDPSDNFKNNIELKFAIELKASNKTEYFEKEFNIERDAVFPYIFGENQIEINKNSITKNSFNFSIKIVDYDNLFDLNFFRFYSNGKSKKVNLISSRNEKESNYDYYVFQVSGLIQGTKYKDFKISFTGNQANSISVSDIGGITVLKTQGISPSLITAFTIAGIVLGSLIVLIIISLLIWKRKVWVRNARSSIDKWGRKW